MKEGLELAQWWSIAQQAQCPGFPLRTEISKKNKSWMGDKQLLNSTPNNRPAKRKSRGHLISRVRPEDQPLRGSGGRHRPSWF